jgi:large subunit ribosomal protein L14
LVIFRTRLIVKDNSGARWVRVLRVLGKDKKTAFVGDIVLVSVLNYVQHTLLKKRSTFLGVIIGIVCWKRRLSGVFVKFFFNSVLLFSKHCKFLGTRVYGLFLLEVNVVKNNDKKNRQFFLKIISYNRGLI